MHDKLIPVLTLFGFLETFPDKIILLLMNKI